MKTPIILAFAAMLAGSASAAVVTWTPSAATASTEVSNAGTTAWAYYFNSNTGRPAVVNVNGVDFNRISAGDNTATPGLNRGSGAGGTNFEDNDEFYLGPNASLNQIMDGVTWGGDSQFQITGLTIGTMYQIQIFSSDDRGAFINRVLDLDSSWATANGSRQLENVDYTAGGPWVDPAGRSKIFLGSFTADATTQEILAALDNGTGQIDLNAAQLRVIPEPAVLLTGAAAFGLLALRRRRR